MSKGIELSDFELYVMRSFHQDYFSYESLKKFKKPDIEAFIEKEHIDHKRNRWRLILSLYYFKFWCLAYIIRRPSDEFVQTVFSQYKD